MTHGEKWLVEKENSVAHMNNGNYVGIYRLPPRMGYKEACAYYTKKIRDYFEQQLTIKQFDKVEDYFGYYEALKIRNTIWNTQ